MKSIILRVLCVVCVIVAQVLAQKVQTEALALRVTATRPGGVIVVDRGSADGLLLYDRVIIQPLGAKSQDGVITRLEDRSAEVRLADPNAVIPLGSQGLVQIPVSRFAPEVEELVADAAPEVEGAPAAKKPAPSPWSNDDSEFDSGMPLLVRIDGVRPEQRSPLISGRIYTIAEIRASSDDDRSDTFARLGTDLHFENPFGQGGELIFEGETNYRYTDVQNQVDESTTKARVDRLSYAWGGTRFEHDRHEAGRFLQHAVPELGVLDGYEWSRRQTSGNRFGASAGYLPDQTPSMSSGRDFSASAFYQWAADEREELTATGAFQKTWHNGEADRDLLVGKLNYWPQEGWDFHGTAWIDYYTSGDESKGSGPELTRFVGSSGKRWADGDGANFTFTHNQYPLTKKDDLPTLHFDQIANDHDERLGGDAWTWLNKDRRMHGRLGLWVDQEDAGGDAEWGVEQHGIGHENGRASASLFGVSGKFSTVYGARLAYGIQATSSRWDISYEFALTDQLGFSSTNDEIEQHRLLASHDWQSSSGWSISVNAGATFWIDEVAATAGIYLQRSF